MWTRAHHECRDRRAGTVSILQAGLTSRGPLSPSPVPALPCAFRNPGQQWPQPGLQHTHHPPPPALQARRWLLDLGVCGLRDTPASHCQGLTLWCGGQRQGGGRSSAADAPPRGSREGCATGTLRALQELPPNPPVQAVPWLSWSLPNLPQAAPWVGKQQVAKPVGPTGHGPADPLWWTPLS